MPIPIETWYYDVPLVTRLYFTGAALVALAVVRTYKKDICELRCLCVSPPLNKTSVVLAFLSIANRIHQRIPIVL